MPTGIARPRAVAVPIVASLLAAASAVAAAGPPPAPPPAPAAPAGEPGGLGLRVTASGVSVTGDTAALSADRIVPGFRRDVVMNVANERDEDVTVSVRVTGLRDDDEGCTEPEQRVDDSCGPGEGDLGRLLRLWIGAPGGTEPPGPPGPAGPGGPGTGRGPAEGSGAAPVGAHWSATVTEAAAGPARVAVVPRRATARLRICLWLPADTDNRVQSDAVRFGLTLGAGAAGAARPGRADETTLLVDTVADGQPSGDGTDQAAGAAAALAATAALAGAGLWLTARRRRPRRGPAGGRSPAPAADARERAPRGGSREPGGPVTPG